MQIRAEQLEKLENAEDKEEQLEKAGADLEAIEELATELAAGEFVVRKLSWELKAVKIED